MKKSISKILIGIGSLWLFILFAFFCFSLLFRLGKINFYLGGLSLDPRLPTPSLLSEVILFFKLFLTFGLPGIILIIIGVAKWNSEKRK